VEYRTLGRTGTAVSAIALGTMYFGGETGEEDPFAVLDAFVEAGCSLIDTAKVYVGRVSDAPWSAWCLC
jgi:aryl-alcohol dehydrogenase-like predicted oxidoreductase